MFVKRLFDLFISLGFIVFLIPMYLLISFIILLTIGRPILFIQSRVGLNAKIFKLYKFRTMNNNKDEYDPKISDESRLTKFGKFLRKTSLDELPNFFNVLKGDMSLVGPRPLLVDYLDRYSLEQARRHEVRPGITGWAQINGRNSISWEHKFEFDLWYVLHRSNILDIKILLLTIKRVLMRKDISQNNHATMEEFHKSNEN